MSTCGTCTLCCKVMAIDELNKPAGEWCVNCNKTSGCGIYNERPVACKDFECVWLQSQSRDTPWPDALKPSNCRVVFAVHGQQLVAHVDPQRPDAIHGRSVRALIDRWVQEPDGTVVVAIGNRRQLIKGMPRFDKVVANVREPTRS